MPFKNITSPRRILDLGAEVRGAALLSNPSIVAMVSTNPVRLGFQPTSGSGGKNINVSLPSVEEVAFISKDVAVVRSGDDVWALIDLAHTPKVEQVARDVRQLCMRPTGEVALALGWDGSATALTLAQHEVTARPFALRGTVRACDVGATETVVVVDGADGGELRIHPGPTPEPGATHRASLPREAAKLDRVRGGRDLSALFRRGGSSVCIVTRGGAKLTAKMIDLGSAPIDLAVVETSLFATFADGRVLLYDGDSLARAEGGAPDVVSTLSLGARGEPRAMIVAGKGTPTLWIGTSTGEMMQATAMRKAASI